MSIFKPTRRNTKRDLIDQALRDIDPLVRDKAREILETLNEEELRDPDKVREILRRKKII